MSERDPLLEARRLSEEMRRLFPVGPANDYEGSTARAIHEFADAYDALAQRVEDAERLLRELAPLAPTGSANVHEEAERQRIHQRVIELLGLPDPGEFVRSDYWLRLERQALRQEEK